MTLVHASAALTPDGDISPWWVRLRGEVIVEAGPGEPPEPAEVTIAEGVLSPGFVDVHVHGGGGASFLDGPDAARTARAAHLRHGTTTMLASLVTDPYPAMRTSLAGLRPLVDSGEIAGVHLEGPWLNSRRRGAHHEEHLRDPDAEVLDEFLATGLIRMVTLAPELAGGMEAVSRIVESGVVAAVGHTEASYEQTRQALARGASVGTHLFNAMPSLHHRRPGPIAALLEDPEAWVELIADGIHVHPSVQRLAFTTKAQRCVLVSDAMSAAAAADGRYRLGSLEVRVDGGEARVVEASGELGSIAGSTLTVSAAVRHSVLTADIPLAQALIAATANPARMVGLEDVGALAPGNRADLVLLDDDLQVTGVMSRGVWQPGTAGSTD
ncbi:N-acetylglucosamine-6-phosphate deacetylase [Nesterenkonia xinjiangensis]|uniref:N-acetylglucosamine-6-phosphate deacetylase n=1 Tax=Nesterenkonia xinjiangensis TaxID=225327 RepID=A0A7Z0GLV5_9MICC|nr:N-acetylglucosamine-6-phosphate deacetylase [Nesterenkonia xinjiangensis]NYJ78282.1 N-acetylglucosamine-6-phosphate deacetylase [Nesterenkonia xinjiangensis]